MTLAGAAHLGGSVLRVDATNTHLLLARRQLQRIADAHTARQRGAGNDGALA